MCTGSERSESKPLCLLTPLRQFWYELDKSAIYIKVTFDPCKRFITSFFCHTVLTSENYADNTVTLCKALCQGIVFWEWLDFGKHYYSRWRIYFDEFQLIRVQSYSRRMITDGKLCAACAVSGIWCIICLQQPECEFRPSEQGGYQLLSDLDLCHNQWEACLFGLP